MKLRLPSCLLRLSVAASERLVGLRRERLIDADLMLNEMAEFVDFLFDETSRFFSQHLSDIDVVDCSP